MATRIGLAHYKLLRDFDNSISSETQILKNDILIKGNVIYVQNIKVIAELNKNYKQEHDVKLQNIIRMENLGLMTTNTSKLQKMEISNN